jgi:hypothetical protein
MPKKISLTQPTDTSLVVSLGGSKVVKQIPARDITISSVTIESIIDSSKDKTVTAIVKGYPGNIVLWEGAAYDAIGQWTDADVISKIKEIYK